MNNLEYIYIYICIIACIAQLAKALDTQAAGRVFDPRPAHLLI